MLTETINYQCDELKLKGYLAYSKDLTVKRPGVLVVHGWKGQDDFVREKAENLAELGYIAFAVDLYGECHNATNDEEAEKLMMPLFLDRRLLQKRILSGYQVLKNHPNVNPKKIGAIGFCFGGLTVIELLRAGADLAGIVSFHGLLAHTIGDQKASLAPLQSKVHGSVLILTGYQDPLVTKEDLSSIQDEFTRYGLDWQIHIYGNAKHAFTNPDANNIKAGLIFNLQAATRAWQSMCYFFDEIFS